MKKMTISLEQTRTAMKKMTTSLGQTRRQVILHHYDFSYTLQNSPPWG